MAVEASPTVGPWRTTDRSAANLRQVEGVERLGRTPGVTSLVPCRPRSLMLAAPDGRQPLDEPRRAGADPHAANRAGPSRRGRCPGPRSPPSRWRRHRLRPRADADRARAAARSKSAASSPGHADMAQAVGPVAGDLDLDRRIAAPRFGRFMVQPREQQPVDDRRNRRRELHVIRQPVEERIMRRQNCSRKRTSLR